MKNSVIKVLSVIMALCLFASVMPVSAYAMSDGMTEVESVSIIEFSPETELPVTFGSTMNNFYSNGTDVDTQSYFYNQLTANQKAIYKQLLDAGPVETVDVNMTGISITGKGSYSSAESVAVNNAQQEIMIAMTALIEDNPMYFWASGFGLAYGGSRKYSAGSYVYTISALRITVNLNTAHFTDYNDVKAKVAAVEAKISEIPVYGISRHEKLKSINDYLANNIAYDNTIAEPNIFDVYGALINGICVCEGYAESLKLLCDREGIPCITVVGNGNGGAHKWNMVQMEDGEWYVLDSTWNDQTDSSNPYVFYSYFLTGSNTRASYFHPDVADSTIHVPTGKIFSSANTALTYPTLSTDTYGIGLLRYDAKDVQFDTVRDVIMVGKDVANYYQYITNNSDSGFSRTRKGTGTTTSTLTVSDSTTTKEYLVAMRGDINASNKTDATDYNVMTQVCATTNTVEKNSAKFYAGDMNQDGAVDGFDVIAHELYTNGTLLYN